MVHGFGIEQEETEITEMQIAPQSMLGKVLLLRNHEIYLSGVTLAVR